MSDSTQQDTRGLPIPLLRASIDRLRNPPVRLTVLTVVLYVCLRPVLAFGHQLTVAAIGWTSHAFVAGGVWQPVIAWLGLDPIYAGAAVRAAGGCEVSGLAVAGAPGDLLHILAPAVFLEPTWVARGATVSTIVVPGAPALGRGIASLGADGVWIALGCWLLWQWRNRNSTVALLGLLIQGQIAIVHLLEAHVRLGDIDASGLPFAVAVATPAAGWFTLALAQLPESVQHVLIGGVLMLVGYAVAACLLVLGWSVGWLTRRPFRGARAAHAAAKPVNTRERVPLAFGAVLAVIAAVSPVGALAVGATNWQTGTAVVPSGRALTPGAAGRQRELIYSPRTAVATRKICTWAESRRPWVLVGRGWCMAPMCTRSAVSRTSSGNGLCSGPDDRC